MEEKIVQISVHMIGVAAHRDNAIESILAQKNLEGVELTWEQGVAEFDRLRKG
jgi:hypothetical protein